jgi:hypothetical protein
MKTLQVIILQDTIENFHFLKFMLIGQKSLHLKLELLTELIDRLKKEWLVWKKLLEEMSTLMTL